MFPHRHHHLRRRVPRRAGRRRAHLRRTRDRRARPRVAVRRDPARRAPRRPRARGRRASCTTSPTRSRPTTTPDHDRRGADSCGRCSATGSRKLVGVHVVAKRYLVTTEPGIARRSATAAPRRSPRRATRSRRAASTRCRSRSRLRGDAHAPRADERAKDPHARRARPRRVARRPRAVRPALSPAAAASAGAGRRSSRRRFACAMRRRLRSWPRRARCTRSMSRGPRDVGGQERLVERAHAVDVVDDRLRVRDLEHRVARARTRATSKDSGQDRLARSRSYSARTLALAAGRSTPTRSRSDRVEMQLADLAQVRVAVQHDERVAVGTQHTRELATPRRRYRARGTSMWAAMTTSNAALANGSACASATIDGSAWRSLASAAMPTDRSMPT